MGTLESMFAIIIGAIFVNNYLLAQFLGMCPFFGVSKKLETAFGMGAAVTFVMLVASTITFLFDKFVLVTFNIEFLRTIVFILTIASIVQFLEAFMRKNLPVLYALLGIYLPLITVNCAIFGVVLINIRDGFSFIGMLTNSFAAGIGYTLAICILAVIREKYDKNPDIPKIFQGFPLALFSAGFMSIAFMGFQGLV